jgi:transcriptional regulator
MHPNPAFRSEDRALHEALIDQVGFSMIFAQTSDGPRVAHTPLLSTGDGAVRFHIARGNALTRHLAGTEALALVNGPDAYVSPRWYVDQKQVPTWNYVALEIHGPVREIPKDSLVNLLDALAARHEARIPGQPWTREKMDEAVFEKMLGAIVGFEMEVRTWRPTFKLSQNKASEDRARVADALDGQGAPSLAKLMRSRAS